MPIRGKYKTHQREAVLGWFEEHPDLCVDAETVYNALHEKGQQVGKTTIYRAISNLCAENILRKYSTDEQDHSAIYQYSPCTDSHLHIRCTKCGTLEHLHCDEVDAFCSHLLDHHHFTLDINHTVLYGICSACRECNE